MHFNPIAVTREKKLVLLDQTLLPAKLVYNEYTDYRKVIDAIKRLEVRGAPAIGIAAAYAVGLAAEAVADKGWEVIRPEVQKAAGEIKDARPTAVNLVWAVDRILNRLAGYRGRNVKEFNALIWEEAEYIHEEDRQMCDAMGRFGAELLPDEATVLTHCNAGALATGGIGTALGVIYKAVEMGKKIKVLADETRPLLQGARLTCWELMQEGIECRLITDNMAGFAMARRKIDAVIVGADRITKNGDVANKIGTYSVAVLAEKHGIPFYVAAPESTFDKILISGDQIIVEERDSKEVTEVLGRRIAPDGAEVWSPAFDITPHQLVSSYITDTGVRPGGRS